MANHFQMIGLLIDDDEALEEYAFRACDFGEPINTDGQAYYCRWRVGGGAELWAAIDEGDVTVDLSPHFTGGASMRVAITGRIIPDDATTMVGRFHAWANPDENDDDPESGDYPFVFAAPDFAVWAALPLPATVSVSLAAFAHELDAYPDEDAYMASQEGELKYAAESFIPSGLFTDGENKALPTAIFAGRVLETEVRSLPDSWRTFVWARIRTLGGEVDVVAARDEVRGEVVPGGIISGTFWLSGRIAGEPPAPADAAEAEEVRPWWRRLLGS